jgi:DEAD/DEAH box helicase domain-containing protein
MELDAFLQLLQQRRTYGGQIVHVEQLPERPAVYGELAPESLDSRVWSALHGMGITRLYQHQVEAVNHVLNGRSTVIVTGTASGKTLCYNIPVVNAVVRDPLATALFVYPTKALAQDQLRAINRFGDANSEIKFLAGAYDGDTPQNERRKLRDRGAIILTNPDMLHQGILPQHSRWNRYFSNLRYVVLDEVHSYRGVFGSHLANVLRRLKRICTFYGSSPQFICCSATIANPREHAESIAGIPMELVDQDGSPRGPKRFVFWNPPVLAEHQAAGSTYDAGGERRSPLWEAVELMTLLVKENVQTIAFVRTRLMAELVFHHAREYLDAISPRLARSVHAYRGGYLPEERREIERKLASGEILGVASTNALELGIDIGSLDASILVGYPGTIASTWQQAGRAGRAGGESVVFMVAENSPIDQYLMSHSDYIFAESPEQAVIDPDNPHVAIGHIKCAVHELPVSDDEAPLFGEYAVPMLEMLEDTGCVRHIAGRWYWASEEYPAAGVNLRNICGPVYTIQDAAEGNRVIGTMDEISALAQLHTHAVYLHGAETFFVENLDLDKKIAFVTKRELDYYTQSIQVSRIMIDETEEETEWRNASIGFGDVTVTTTIPMFKKIKFHSRDSLGFEKLDMPPQSLETVALWLVPPDSAVEAVKRENRVFAEGLIGVANALVECAPLYVMCDTQNIGAVVDASNLGKDALFLYDRYPGGMGYAQRCVDAMEELMQAVYDVVGKCPCEGGCPSCVGSAVPAFAMTDLDSGTRGRIPDKVGALIILREILGRS